MRQAEPGFVEMFRALADVLQIAETAGDLHCAYRFNEFGDRIIVHASPETVAEAARLPGVLQDAHGVVYLAMKQVHVLGVRSSWSSGGFRNSRRPGGCGPAKVSKEAAS